jgi:DNA fragmentation factor beta subunit
MNGYKVSDAKRCLTVGVACQTLNELREKGRVNLKITQEVNIQLADGTCVNDEDYFQLLSPQTEFLFLKPGETAITKAEILCSVLQDVKQDILRTGNVPQEFQTPAFKESVMEFVKLIEHKPKNVHLSSKADDPAWFEGTTTNSATKEEFMSRLSQKRIRGYMNKTKGDITKSEIYKKQKMCQKKLIEAFLKMEFQLKVKNYFGGYFDRNVVSDRLCDREGNFECRGRWDVDRCQYTRVAANKHMINPYASKEARRKFSDWNFDHMVERKRSIVPALLEAAKQASEKKRAINADYFYRLLYTTENLKLVHTVCHDKRAHNKKCDSSKLTVRD